MGLRIPEHSFPHRLKGDSGHTYLLNKSLQAVLSEFVRRTMMPLPPFVELIRMQTDDNYRPNKEILPGVLRHTLTEYDRRDALMRISCEGVRVRTQPICNTRRPPRNHCSATEQLYALLKNVRTEQDSYSCLVLGFDLIEIWPKAITSPFGVVDKSGNNGGSTSEMTIHDISFRDSASINDIRMKGNVPDPEYQYCGPIFDEVLRLKDTDPNTSVPPPWLVMWHPCSATSASTANQSTCLEGQFPRINHWSSSSRFRSARWDRWCTTKSSAAQSATSTVARQHQSSQSDWSATTGWTITS